MLSFILSFFLLSNGILTSHFTNPKNKIDEIHSIIGAPLHENLADFLSQDKNWQRLCDETKILEALKKVISINYNQLSRSWPTFHLISNFASRIHTRLYYLSNVISFDMGLDQLIAFFKEVEILKPH
jgi:hypothetical protein